MTYEDEASNRGCTEECLAEDGSTGLLGSMVTTAAGTLSRVTGQRVRLSRTEVLREPEGRSCVLRCRVEEGSQEIGESVVVKRALRSKAEETDGRRAAERFDKEVVGLTFLHRLSVSRPPVPKLLATEPQELLIVMEDLGRGTSLADLLTADDPGAATEALLTYAASLGRLHAATAGREAEYVAAGGRVDTRVSEESATAFEELGSLLDELTGSRETAWNREATRVGEALREPGPFLVFNIMDACPDNHLLEGDHVRFFDLEFARFGHALLEGSYLRLPFPTCWCMGRLPDHVQRAAIAVYRRELIQGCPEAANDGAFELGMTIACAFWTCRSVASTLRWALQGDEEWGLVSIRRRAVYRLEALATQSTQSRELQAIGAGSARLASELRRRWQDQDLTMPVYPAFGAGVPIAESRALAP
ncbi:MAG TPA: hypothetical protein VFB34_03215 [Chloroflexota bacterium]|nr:hypothetical protein [Chloroflexota bacterium]